MRSRFAALVLAAAALTGCSSVIARIDTNPSMATCTVTQSNVTVATIQTPGNLALEASPGDTVVACSKDGYQSTRTTLADRTAADGPVRMTEYARSESGIDRAYVIVLAPSTQPKPEMAPAPRPTAANLTPFPKQPRRPGMEQATLPAPALPAGDLPRSNASVRPAAAGALPAPAIPPAGGNPNPMATLAAEAEREAKAASRAETALAGGNKSSVLQADSEALAMAQAQDTTMLEDSLLGEDELLEEESAVQEPRWHTQSASVTAHRRPFPDSPAVSMPPDVPLKLVDQEGGWGLFEYETNFGSSGVAWIRLEQVQPPV